MISSHWPPSGADAGAQPRSYPPDAETQIFLRKRRGFEAIPGKVRGGFASGIAGNNGLERFSDSRNTEPFQGRGVYI
ncbi:hypothetical protein FJ930_01220 [Mesorhizobium sp. B2-4-15]|nr:hypothetical protein [Mesorhizobium sp. B2-4-15]TPK77281.1 hypothetical protein FJ930_01220 [Mesorhizobium sp. B2-4-15]